VMNIIALVLLFAIAACSAEQVRYDNHVVIRVSLTNQTDYPYAYAFADKHMLDIWATNAVEGWMDIMISPEKATLLDSFNLPHVVRIPNVQAEIDESEAQRKISRDDDEFFSDFQTSGTIFNWMQEQVTKYPGKQVKFFSIGQTYLENEIYALELGKDTSGVFVIQCGIHAREWITPATCCWIIDQLLSNPANEELLEQYLWVIIPSFNVDGYDYTHTNARLWRKNRAPSIYHATCIGTDINRNYEYGWSGPGASPDPCSETYYGDEAVSAPASKAIKKLLDGHFSTGKLVSYFDIHAYGALWMSPWGYTTTLPPSGDYAEMARVMQVATAAVRGVNNRVYTYGPIARVIYQTSGGSTDYTYGHLGCVHSYAVETFGSSFTPLPSTIPVIGAEVCAGVLATARAMLASK